MDIDKAVSSTTHRLVKEAIAFKKQTLAYDSTDQYRNSGFSILEAENEPLATRRVAELVSLKGLRSNSMKIHQSCEATSRSSFKSSRRKALHRKRPRCK